MKKVILLLSVVLILVSCSNGDKEAFEKIKTKICEELKNNNTSSGIIEAGKMFNNEFSSKFELSEDEKSEYLTKLRPCFANMGFKKVLKPQNSNPIEGSLAKYLKLEKSDVEIVLKNENAPAFSIDFVFAGISKRDNDKEFEIVGTITLFDIEHQPISTYNFYPVPDFYNTINKGTGDFNFTAYLDAIWYPYAANPFPEAVKYFELMSNAEFYSLKLNIKGEELKDKDKEHDKEYHEMLDNLEMMNAANPQMP